MAEGVKIVDEFMRKDSYIQAETLLATEDWIKNRDPVLKDYPAVEVWQVNKQELDQISNVEAPQQVVAICKIPDTPVLSDLSQKISLALETIQDPGNMGTILRIADWYGIENVICLPDCVDIFNPKTVLATMGSIARVRVMELPLEKIGEKWKNIPVFAATLTGQDIRRVLPIKEGIILIGNEGHGLSEKALSLANHCITIPRIGKAESLNVAVATGIICERLIK